MRDPDQRMPVDDGKSYELAALLRHSIEDRLADVRNSRCDVELLAENGEPHGEPIEARAGILLDPALLDQCREQAMSAALGQRQALRNLPKRQALRPVGKEPDDGETALGWYVRHRFAP